MSTTRRLLAIVSCVPLVACSALQIDVDVYKGSLANEHEIQLRQFANLPETAKPMLERLRDLAAKREGNPAADRANSADPDCRVTRDKAMLAGRMALDFTCNLLDMYDKIDGGEGLNELRKSFFAAMDSRFDPKDPLMGQRFRRLTDGWIRFADQMLFVVNNEVLHKELGASGDTTHEAKTAVLQSLGNVILIHANDLQRQHERMLEQSDRAVMEQEAQRNAFTVTPASAYERLLQSAREQARRDASVKSTSATVESEAVQSAKRELDEAKTKAETEFSSVNEVRVRWQPLIRFHRTVFGIDEQLFPADDIELAERGAAARDADTLQRLFPLKTPFQKDEQPSGWAISTIAAWLNNELAKASQAPGRLVRLKDASKWLADQGQTLDGALAGAKDKADAWTLLRAHVNRQAAEPTKELRDALARHADAKRAMQRADQKLARERARQKEDEIAGRRKTLEAQALAVLNDLRTKVLAQAEASTDQRPTLAYELLKSSLDSMKPATGGGRPNQADIDYAKEILPRLRTVTLTSCASSVDASKQRTQMDVADCLIADLRAQRVQALAEGRSPAARRLQEAINAAHDQRTGMLYLRPAADYLRSVYSSTAFQDGTVRTYRNMLNDWGKFLAPEKLVQGDYGKEQLEKLHWQNINKVTLGGGGTTNYVLAKDDVGNWYVKAYESNPEAVFKSATSLALFNSGRRINTNLLRRYQIQQQIDDPKTSGNLRTNLTNELSDMKSQDGTPLLRVRERYLARYRSATESQAGVVLAEFRAQKSAVEAALGDKPEPADGCKIDAIKEVLGVVSTASLDGARQGLATLIEPPTSGEEDKRLVDMETALRRALNALFLYGRQVAATVAEAGSSGCSEAWRAQASRRAQEVPRTALLKAATDRKQAIERYEEALASVAEVATAE